MRRRVHASQPTTREPSRLDPIRSGVAAPRPGGNQVVSRLLQAKLTVGPAGDAYEQEADRVARDVVRRLRAAPRTEDAAEDSGGSHRIGGAGPVRLRAEAPAAGIGLQGGDLDASTEAMIQNPGGGASLPRGLRSGMEQAFGGADFSGVRVHTDRSSDGLARSLSAHAFTSGHDIFFRQGQYRPDSATGQETLAHELTHVVQQRGVARCVQRAKTKDGLSPADRARKQGAVARGANAQMNLQADIAPLESALKKLKAREGSRTAADAAAAAQVRDQAKRVLAALPGASTKKTKQLLGEMFPQERRRLRYIIDDAQIICDEYSVVQTKERAGQIYMDAGKNASPTASPASGGFKKLTGTSKALAFNDIGVDPTKAGAEKRAQMIRKAGADLGLSPAETAAILTFTAEDYRYINPATANSEGWMKAKNEDLIDKPNLTPDEKATLKASFKDVKFGNARERMNERKKDLADRKEEGSLHAGMAMQGFAKMPVWTGPAYRGEVLTQADFDKKFKLVSPGMLSRRKGKKYKARDTTITRSAISSSSKEEQVARNFWFIAGRDVPDPKVKVLWQMDLTNGRDIEPISNSPNEKEVATLPGAAFAVVDTAWFEGQVPAFSYLLVKCKQVK